MEEDDYIRVEFVPGDVSDEAAVELAQLVEEADCGEAHVVAKAHAVGEARVPHTVVVHPPRSDASVLFGLRNVVRPWLVRRDLPPVKLVYRDHEETIAGRRRD